MYARHLSGGSVLADGGQYVGCYSDLIARTKTEELGPKAKRIGYVTFNGQAIHRPEPFGHWAFKQVKARSNAPVLREPAVIVSRSCADRGPMKGPQQRKEVLLCRQGQIRPSNG